MEAATISSPQRKLNVVPVQKSLSLPSYAKAGGEGIDHRVIFAALEQREKIRRKSRIFTREKTARQNIFCLPISSGNKCRETSLSSDTSCSSLEYQKPKSASKPKKDEKQQSANETPANEHTAAKTSQSEAKSKPSHTDVAAKPVVEGNHELQQNSLKAADYRRGHRSPSDTLRPHVNSSDSMERSSRSSNDSLSRKERLVAIKAKVEAAREKYGDTSSEDENRSAITRYNSDGVIHRTVREVKTRSYRMEKRLRRRSQDEYALKKANRKNNLSLCLNSIEDGIKLELDRPFNIFEDGQNLECKTDFCPSPNFLEFTRKNYFSDFPSKENMSRIVQTRIRHIEEEERKRRNSVDFRDKNKISSRQSPQNTETSSPFSTQRKNVYSSQNAFGSLDSEKNSPSSDVLHCPSPVGRAPTPPPRSPKSMTFINKAYIQHQNSYLNHDSHSLERRPYFQPNIPVTSQNKSGDKINPKCDAIPNDSKTSFDFVEGTTDKRKMRELMSSRRKTCGYFDYADNYAFKELNSTVPSKSPANVTNLNVSQPKATDSKGYLSETPTALPERRMRRSNWDEAEKRHEFMFNSLESKKKALSPTWLQNSGLSQSNENCLCYILSGNKSTCTCHSGRTNKNPRMYTNPSSQNKGESSFKFPNMKDCEVQQSCTRLSKSEINIAYSDQIKCNTQNFKSDLFRNLQPIERKPSKEKLECSDHTEKLTATANLDSAMEELESVYRSLKFSSDNLSEKNSASNLSLNDLNAQTSKNDVYNDKTFSDLQYKDNSLKENNLNSSKSNNIKPVDERKRFEFLKLSVYSPTPEIKGNTVCKSPESENLCIDELFNDLTRQLDIEQKLLKESRDNRNENRTPDIPNRNGERMSNLHCRKDNLSLDFQTNKCDMHDQKRMTPLESIVSIRKELYDNLQKSSQDHTRSFNSVSKGVDMNESSQQEMAKKRYKAVRSLSENISYLMASANPSPTVGKKITTEKSDPLNYNNMETLVIEKSSPKHYEHVTLEPLKIETKKEVALNHPIVPKRTFTPDKQKKPLTDEIRQIRVSMDSNAPESKPVPKRQYSEYSRLTSAVCRPQISPKSDASPRLPPPTNVSKDTVDILDESGLEKLLNTLLNDVPESPKQSSLLLTKDDAPTTPPPTAAPAGKCDHVRYKRNILPSKMDAYMAATAKSQVPATDCSPRLKAEEVAQVKKEFCQNNAHLNQMSFIPVYSNKTVCHKFSKSKKECENLCENPASERKVLTTYSPPTRPRCTANNDLLAARIAKTHIRRRSVGFEDMTSLSSYFGHNFTNDRRFQSSVHNSNLSQSSTENHSAVLQSDNTQSVGKLNTTENKFTSWNHNAQLTSSENANDHLQRRLERPLQRYKDKSSKRKSSLNRMDFIHFPSPNTGSSQYPSDLSQQKNNSSSDEGSESRLHTKKSESPCSTTKRKHSASNHITSKSELKTNEVTLRNSSPSKVKSNILPRSSPTSHSSPRLNRWKQSSTARFSQKLSHSAGELETLTDFSEVPSRNKTYLSAQEYGDRECSRVAFNSSNSGGVIAKSNFLKLSPKHLGKEENPSALKNTCDNTSQVDTNSKATKDERNMHHKESDLKDLAHDCDNSQSTNQKEIINSKIDSEQIVSIDSKNSDLKFDCDDSINTVNDGVETSAIQLESLAIADDSKNADVYLSADESLEVVGSDGERRPNSILRKKSSEERKELHSILKPPPEDKFSSKTPPSILKHRESSEEKDIWQPNDLHSILKKSTSEDESCNSGPDIRPILKLSTDEDSPSGAVRPRPILKKRTSFSDECSYVSFPSGELKPILKKKTPLSSDEQPKPILKSRRKSEDTRSTMSEVITSRPRAYSADMGVKLSHESQMDSSEAKKDFRNVDSHDL